MLRKAFGALAAAALVLGASSSASAATITLNFGTLAPATSLWGGKFREWAQKVKEDIKKENDERAKKNEPALDDVDLVFHWNGVKGDEPKMVEIMSDATSNELDGALLTAAGLGKIDVNVLIFQLPGLFRPDKLGYWKCNGESDCKPGNAYLMAWGKLDRARGSVWSHFQQSFDSKGFFLMEPADVGASHVLSIGSPIQGPGDLSGKLGYRIPGDSIAPELARLAGIQIRGETSVAAIATELGGSINTLITPSLAAESFGWTAKVTHINVLTTGYNIGGGVMTKKGLNKLRDPKLQEIVKKRGNEMSVSLRALIRNADHAAFERMAGALYTEDECTNGKRNDWKKTPIDCSTADKLSNSLRPYKPGTKTAYESHYAQKNEWYALFDRTRASLRQQIFDQALYDKIAQAGR